MIRLGLGTFGVAWSIGVPNYPQPTHPLDAARFLQMAHDLGLKVVQFGDNLPLHKMPAAQRKALKAQADRLGLQAEVGMRGIQPPDLETYIRIAAEFESPLLRVVVDSPGHHPEPDEVASIIRGVLPLLASHNVVLAIENHDRYPARVLADLVQELATPSVGICLDTVNSFGSLEGPEVVVGTLAPFVVNLHVKEFVIRRVDHNMGFVITGAPAGQGMLDIPWLIGKIQAHRPTFNAIVETWLPPLADMDATAALEREWVRQSVQYLRTLIKD